MTDFDPNVSGEKSTPIAKNAIAARNRLSQPIFLSLRRILCRRRLKKERKEGFFILISELRVQIQEIGGCLRL